jgi:hypothetical protein
VDVVKVALVTFSFLFAYVLASVEVGSIVLDTIKDSDTVTPMRNCFHMKKWRSEGSRFTPLHDGKCMLGERRGVKNDCFQYKTIREV